MKLRNKIALGATSLVASAGVFAADHSTAITAASTDATGNVTAVITAVISVAAVVFGAGLVYRWLSR